MAGNDVGGGHGEVRLNLDVQIDVILETGLPRSSLIGSDDASHARSFVADAFDHVASCRPLLGQWQHELYTLFGIEASRHHGVRWIARTGATPDRPQVVLRVVGGEPPKRCISKSTTPADYAC